MPMLHLELTDAVAYNPTRTARDPRARSVLDATPLSECLPLNSSRTTSEHPNAATNHHHCVYASVTGERTPRGTSPRLSIDSKLSGNEPKISSLLRRPLESALPSPGFISGGLNANRKSEHLYGVFCSRQAQELCRGGGSPYRTLILLHPNTRPVGGGVKAW